MARGRSIADHGRYAERRGARRPGDRCVGPDAVAIQESPSRDGEMRLFVDGFLTGEWEIIGPSGIGAQKLYLLVRRDGRIESARRIWPDQGPLDLSMS